MAEVAKKEKTIRVYNRGEATFITKVGDLRPGHEIEMPEEMAKKFLKSYPEQLMDMERRKPESEKRTRKGR